MRPVFRWWRRWWKNEGITLDLTDATICPPPGTTCSYTIRGLQTGTQYVVTLQIYSGANAAGTRLNNGSVTLMTSGTRPASVVSVAASLSTISEGGYGQHDHSVSQSGAGCPWRPVGTVHDNRHRHHGR